MHKLLASLSKPLNLAGLITIGAVALPMLRWMPQQYRALSAVLLIAFAIGTVVVDATRRESAWLKAVFWWTMPLIALALLWMGPRIGTAPILLVVWAAQIAFEWPQRRVWAALFAVNVTMYFIMRDAGHENALMQVVLYGCFQIFATLVSHYARTAEEARDKLAVVNADLLATRALLADSSRDAERLRVARELHDVAGHKLTALRLNLRALATQPDTTPQLQLAEQLSGELLQDIRGVVHALRDVEGLDIANALQALGAPMPKPRLRVNIDHSVRITDTATAETILRIVQEALTNAARHADADHVDVRLHRDGDMLALNIEDDGKLRDAWREGHGITGMRERVGECGGRIDISRAEHGGMHIHVELPA